MVSKVREEMELLTEMPLFVRLSAEDHFLRASVPAQPIWHYAQSIRANGAPWPAQLPRHVLRVFLMSLLIESEEEE